MKKTLITTFLVFSLSIYFISCYETPNDRVNKISIGSVSHVEIVKTTPNEKISIDTTKKESLDNIVKFINSIELKNSIEIIDEPKVNYMYDFRFSGKSRRYITFYGDIIRYDGTWYKIKENMDDKLNTLFDSLSKGI